MKRLRTLGGRTLVTILVSLLALAGGACKGTATPTSTATPSPSPTTPLPPAQLTVVLTAERTSFDKTTITVPAGASIAIQFNNKDVVSHNFALYKDSTATTPLFVGDYVAVQQATTYRFIAPASAGEYFFRCNAHPDFMTGKFVTTSPVSPGY